MDNTETQEQKSSGLGWVWWVVIAVAVIATGFIYFRTSSDIHARMKKVRDAKKKSDDVAQTTNE
jgi:uncharacterized membrane protein YciS (DUF1049 family)